MLVHKYENLIIIDDSWVEPAPERKAAILKWYNEVMKRRIVKKESGHVRNRGI